MVLIVGVEGERPPQFSEMRALLVVAVNGAAAGAGLGLARACLRLRDSR